MTITVNRQEWEKLDADQQQQIGAIIGEHFEGQTIAAADGNEVAASTVSVCEVACDLAQAEAIKACKKLPSWGRDICIIAAKEAGNYCREQC